MPRFHHMGEGNPPFQFTYSSTEYTIFPPDKRWKQIDEEYSPGVFANGKPKIMKRKIWVVDEAPKGRKPVSYLDLTQDQAQYLCSGKFHEARQYIKSSGELGQGLDQEEDDTVARHAAKMAELEKQFARDIEEKKAEQARILEQLAKVSPAPAQVRK